MPGQVRGYEQSDWEKDTSTQPLQATSVRCEGKVRLQWGCCMLSRQVDHHGERYPVREGIYHVAAGLLRPGKFAVIHRPRWSPVHTIHVEEVCTERTILICQLTGSSRLERWRGMNSGWSGCLTPAIWRKSPLLSRFSHRESGSVTWKKYVLSLACIGQLLSY